MKIVYDMPASDYHAVKALSASGIKEFLKSPAHFKYWQENPKEQTTAMAFGELTHALLLEGDKFNARYVVMPQGMDCRTKEGKEIKQQAESEGKSLLKYEDYQAAQSMVSAAMVNRNIAYHVGIGKKEVSLFWNDAEYGFPCKARFDVLTVTEKAAFIVDYKTTADASLDGFSRQVFNMGYNIQAAWYVDAAAIALPEKKIVCGFIGQEKQAPFLCGLYQCQQDVLTNPKHKIDAVRQQYADCLDTDTWQGYSETFQDLTIPAWA